MSNQFLKLRRSAVPGRIPTTSSLDLGEIALNTYDGLAFMKKSGSSGEQIVTLGTGTSGGSSNITGSQYFIPVFNSTSSLITSSIYSSGSLVIIGGTASLHPEAPERLAVYAGSTNSYNLISGHGSIDSYLQLNIKNFTNGLSASSDIVATAESGDESQGYINMGINNSGYGIAGAIGNALDGYLYTTGSNLLIGNTDPNKSVVIFTGGTNAYANARVYIDYQGSVSINTSTPTPGAPEALLVQAVNNSTYNLITAKSNVNYYSQFNIINRSTGDNASADVVASNNLSTENTYFIDMGINGSNYNQSGLVGDANDAYLYSTGNDLHIGNASNYPLQFFAGGIDSNVNRKLQLNPNNQHEMSGSLNISGSVTSSQDILVNNLTIGRGLGAYINNTVLGSQAGAAFTTAQTNVAIGEQALKVHSTGNANTAVGRYAMLSDVDGSNNTALGASALVFLASGGNTGNTAIGVNGLGRLTSGSYNTWLGYTSAPGGILISGSYNTILGAQINVGVATLNNNIILADGQGNIKYRWDGTQNTISGGLSVTGGSITGSDALFTGTITAQTLVIQTITASVEFVTGSTRFGSLLLNTHQFTGSVSVTGSLAVNGSNVILSSQTSSMSVATASFATSSISASYASTASYWSGSVLNATSASYAATASYWSGSILNAISASFASTASYWSGSILNATSASFASTASYWSGSILNATSASFASTASYISASNIAGLSLSQITLGAVTASVNAGTNIFNIVSGSNTLVVVDNTGSVGIGTTSPGYKLDVNGTARINNAFTVKFPDNNLTAHTTFYPLNGTLGVGITYEGVTAMGTNAQLVLSGNNGNGVNLKDNLNLLAQSGRLYAFGTSFCAGYTVNSEDNLYFNYYGYNGGTTQFRNAIFSNGKGTDILKLFGSTGNLMLQNGGTFTDAGYRLDVNGTARVNGNTQITGSLTVTQGITGSLFGTSSWAQNAITASFVTASNVIGVVTSASFASTASYWSGSILNATSASFASTASYWSGSILNATSASYAATSSLPLRGLITGSVAGATLTFTKGDGTTFDLTVAQSGTVSTASYVTSSGVYGPFGSNSIVTASYALTASYVANASSFPYTGSAVITGSLTVTGSTNIQSLNLGASQFNNTSSVTSAGTTVISQLATGSYTSCFYNYTIASASNARSGQVISVWNGATIRYTEVTTTDIGNTATASFAVALSGANVQLNFTAPGVWTVKNISNLL